LTILQKMHEARVLTLDMVELCWGERERVMEKEQAG
jgi:hypothetical protein